MCPCVRCGRLSADASLLPKKCQCSTGSSKPWCARLFPPAPAGCNFYVVVRPNMHTTDRFFCGLWLWWLVTGGARSKRVEARSRFGGNQTTGQNWHTKCSTLINLTKLYLCKLCRCTFENKHKSIMKQKPSSYQQTGGLTRWRVFKHCAIFQNILWFALLVS